MARFLTIRSTLTARRVVDPKEVGGHDRGRGVSGVGRDSGREVSDG